ncbi:hypothetical protein [Bradyrhizobium sp. HKCCYLR20261]|uniref:hypothetical protein n=1 Tax=Bradyrhizobium sp. HKCCYLR20261 TaxID=3420760 RepID=UPI003EBD3B62
MGEAKRKQKARLERQRLSREMAAARFNVFAIGSRRSPSRLIAEERSYWSDLDERVIGLIFRDRVDNDYGWNLLARDRVGRFRWVDGDVSLRSEQYATDGLRDRIAQVVEEGNYDLLGDQGDETNYPVNLLELPPKSDTRKLHPSFKILVEAPGRAPSRAIFKEIGPWLALSDPHFVQEFQFMQFDQRLWELYLWAALRELGFDIEQPEAPDFLCRAPGIEFAVEATTVAASTAGVLAKHPNPQTREEMQEFLAHYMPMKFGSVLTSKLNKKNKDGESYWERGPAANKPFILAVADFHKPGKIDEPGSMTYTQSALWPYLYGHRVEWELTGGELKISAVKNKEHAYGGKIVPSGFFDLPGAENISAVLFSNAGTLAKFDRMGVAAGFGASGYRYFRVGVRYNHEPNSVAPKIFSEEVSVAHEEFWSDELQMFHNPNAKRPLSPEQFGITQHFFENGEVRSITPENTVLASHTLIFGPAGQASSTIIV